MSDIRDASDANNPAAVLTALERTEALVNAVAADVTTKVSAAQATAISAEKASAAQLAAAADATDKADAARVAAVAETQPALTKLDRRTIGHAARLTRTSYDAVRLLTTDNISLVGLPVIQGVQTVSGDRVIRSSTTSSALNGIYTVGSQEWARSADLNESDEFVAGKLVPIKEGTYAGQTFELTFAGTVTPDTTSIFFASIDTVQNRTLVATQSELDALTLDAGVIGIASDAEDVRAGDGKREGGLPLALKDANGNVIGKGLVNKDGDTLSPRFVANIAALRVLTGLSAGDTVYMRAHTVDGDGGGGWFVYTTTDISAIITAQSHGGTNHPFLAATLAGADGTTGGLLRLDRLKSGTISMVQGGAAPQTSTLTIRQKATINYNAFVAAQAVLTELVADGFAQPTLLWDSHRFDFENYGQGLMNLAVAQRWTGLGMDQTTLYYYDRSQGATSRQDMFRTSSAGISNLRITDLTIEGDLGVGDDWTLQSQLLELIVTGTCAIERLRITKSRFMGIICQDAEVFSARDCELTNIARDGIRPLACETVSITGCYLARLGDDAIAAHSRDDRKTLQPVQRAVIIQGNTFEECLGITCLGMKTGVISDNVMRRMIVRAITIITEPVIPEGNNAMYDIAITDNIIEDVFFGSSFLGGSPAYGLGGFAIHIRGLLDANSSGNPPWGSDGAGGVVDPLDSIYTRDADTALAGSPGAFGITVTNNKIRRTLKPVTNWSDYGFGASLFTKNGPYTGDVAATDFGAIGIKVENFLRDAVFDNIISGFDYAYDFGVSTATTYPQWDNVEIRGIIDRFGKRGIRAGGNGVIRVRNARFNGDPIHDHPDRAANGKWANGADHIALDNRALETLIFDVQHTHFRNCGSILSGNMRDNDSYEQHRIVNNRLCGSPADACLIGWDADNIGVGALPRVSAFSEYEQTDDDPASDTFGRSLRIRPWRKFIPSISFGGAAVGVTYNSSVTLGQVRAVDGIVTEVGRIFLTSKGTSTGSLRINLTAQRGGDETYPATEVGTFIPESAFEAGFNDQVIGLITFANDSYARLRLHDNAAVTTREATDADILGAALFAYAITYTAD